jgi:hypothetical protein
MTFKRSKSAAILIPLCISITAVLPAFSLDYSEFKNRVEESLSAKSTSQMNRSDLRRAVELKNSVHATEKKLAKGGLSTFESRVLLALYEQLDRHIKFNIGITTDHLRAIGFEDVVSSEIGADNEASESMARSGPLDNKFYLLRFKVDAGVYSKQLNSKDAQFFNDEIIRLRKLEDRLSNENGMMRADAKESISKVIDLIDLDLKLRVTEGPFAKVVGARQLKTTCRPAPPAPPYTWYPSRLGGYFEATGQINGRFSEDAIAQYGGIKYKDGNATPISVNHSASLL